MAFLVPSNFSTVNENLHCSKRRIRSSKNGEKSTWEIPPLKIHAAVAPLCLSLLELRSCWTASEKVTRPYAWLPLDPEKPRKSLGLSWRRIRLQYHLYPACVFVSPQSGSLNEWSRREGSSLVLRLDTKSGLKVNYRRDEELSHSTRRVFPSRECNLPQTPPVSLRRGAPWVVRHIAVDEVHDRDFNTDPLLAVLNRLLADRKVKGKLIKVPAP